MSFSPQSTEEASGSASFEIEDEFHPPVEDGDKEGDVERPLELTKKNEVQLDNIDNIVSEENIPAQEVEVKTEENGRDDNVATNDDDTNNCNLDVETNGDSTAETTNVKVEECDKPEVCSVIQPVPPLLEAVPKENIDVITTEDINYVNPSGNQVIYQDDGSFIEYSYQDGNRNIGEAAVQVEYIGPVMTTVADADVEYVTLGEGDERVIGVLKDAGSDYNSLQNVPYYEIRTSDDPIETV